MAGPSTARSLLQRLNPLRLLPSSATNALNNPRLKLPSYSAGTPNLEVIKVCVPSPYRVVADGRAGFPAWGLAEAWGKGAGGSIKAFTNKPPQNPYSLAST